MDSEPGRATEFPPSLEAGGSARGSGDFPGLAQAVGLTVALALMMMGFVVVLSEFAGVLSATAGANFLAAAVVLYWGWRRSGQPAGVVFRFDAFSPRLLLPMFVFLLGASVPLSEIDNATRWLWPPPEELEEIFRDLLAGGWLAILVLLVEAPVIEELVFRGLILRGLIAQKGVQRAIVLQAILFAALHLNPWQFATAFVLGCFLGWLFVETRSLGACILFHAAWNGLSFFLGAYAEDIGFVVPGYTGGALGTPVFQPPAFLALGIGLCVVGGFWLRRACEREAAAV